MLLLHLLLLPYERVARRRLRFRNTGSRFFGLISSSFSTSFTTIQGIGCSEGEAGEEAEGEDTEVQVFECWVHRWGL
jgi:hypothetical protein